MAITDNQTKRRTDMAEDTGVAKAKKEPAEEVLVEMEDGTKVNFVGKRKMNKTSVEADDGSLSVRVDFRNGSTRTYKLNPDLLRKFALHGAEQKYGDEVAGIDDLDDAVVAMDDLHSRLTKGEWTQARESSGFAGASIVIRALMESTGKTQDAIKAFLEGKLEADKAAKEGTEQKPLTRAALYAALRNSEKLKPIVARLEAEKAAKAKGANKVNVDDILAEAGAQ
jgi:hypothetical protein